ncbi:hypothetical protein CcaverHIS631_0411210 [Cutaneotrichosporon cavernicola]|nr:hypothetical protein CcaverHIS631_0411210 [Cutaneotrichosporon cavernicola]
MSNPTPPPFGPREAALAEVLARGNIDDSLAALDEYAWRSLLAGLRVREYCAAASYAVRCAPPTGIRLALVHSPTRLLFPFALPAGAPAAPAPNSFIPPHAFPHLTRRQLVESFVRLARENLLHPVIEAHVHELTLEYVRRRWRGESGAVESIARKLAEVELEVIQTEPFASAAVINALNDVRFQLGLVNIVHLVGRLGAQGTSRSAGDATHLLCAWVVRRLSSGMEPQTVADHLSAMRERLPEPAGDVLPDVLALFCLDGRPPRTSATVTEDTRARPRTLSRISLRATKRRTLPLPLWLSPKASPNLKLPPLDSNRRPSLPALLLPATPPRSNDSEGSPRQGTPTSDSSSPCSTLGTYDSPTFPNSSLPSLSFQPHKSSSPYQSTPDLNSLGLTHWPLERTILVDHLLILRYRLAADVDSWYLGVGRDKAADLLIAVESAGERDTTGVVAQLRYAFGLPVIVIPISRTVSPEEDSAMSLHQRDVSFDLEQYLDDITPVEGGSKAPHGASPLSKPSTSASHLVDLYNARASISTISSALTIDSTATMTSLSDSLSVSSFSIHEARRELPLSAKATTFRVPDRQRVKSLDDAGFPSLLSPYPRFAKSMPDVNDTYTRIPDRTHRPRSTKDFRLLPAFDVEAQHADCEHGVVTDAGHSPLERTSTLVKGYTFPPRKPPRTIPLVGELSPRRPSLDEGDRSRRQKFRQCVIVDGTRVSPYASPKTEPQDLTAFGAILTLFQPGADSSTEAVERTLLKAVKNEERRLGALGEVFDAEARARLAWLLEQVGQEIARPDLVCAVDRVLYTISSPTRPLWRTPSTYKVSTPRNRMSQQIRSSASTKPLSIVVPPREHAGIELEVDLPSVASATLLTFGRSRSTSPSIAESDEDSLECDATPTMPAYPLGTPPLRIRRAYPKRYSPLNLHRRSALRHRTIHPHSSTSPSPTDTPTTSHNTTPTASLSPLATPSNYQTPRAYTPASMNPIVCTDTSLKPRPISPPSQRLAHAVHAVHAL